MTTATANIGRRCNVGARRAELLKFCTVCTVVSVCNQDVNRTAAVELFKLKCKRGIYLPFFFFFFFFFHLTYSRWTSSLPSCLWSQRIFPSLPGSRLNFFLSRSKFSTLTTRQPMVEFYLLTFPRFPLRKKEHKSYFGKNRTHDFRTSRCAAYLLDHSGDELHKRQNCLWIALESRQRLH